MTIETQTPPRGDIAHHEVDLEDVLDGEFPSVSVAGARKRLFTVLAWSGAGFAAIAALSIALTALSGAVFHDVGIGSAAACVVIGLAGFVAVVGLASHLDAHQRAGAHLLLWATTLAYAVLINVFAAAFTYDDGAHNGHILVSVVAGAVAATGAGVLGVLAIAIAIGFDSPLRSFVRWLTLVGVAAASVIVYEPELWWVGLIAGGLLAFAVEITLNAALERLHVPEPALAACLVAGVTALVLLVIYTLVRFAIRVSATLAAGAAEGAANS